MNKKCIAKKNIKNALIMNIVAFLLAFVIGFLGDTLAWFTDTDTVTGTVTTALISVELEEDQSGTWTSLGITYSGDGGVGKQPGDAINSYPISAQLYGSSVTTASVYLMLTVTYTTGKVDLGTLDSNWVAGDSGTDGDNTVQVYYWGTSGTDIVNVVSISAPNDVASGRKSIFSTSCVIDPDLTGDAEMGQSITVTIKVDAIQTVNIDSAALQTAWGVSSHTIKPVVT